MSTQIKNIYNAIGEPDPSVAPSSLALKLSFSQQAVKYFIQSLTHHQVVLYGHHTLHHVENDDDLASRIERIFRDDQILQPSYGEVIIGIDTPYTLVPSGINLPSGTTSGAAIRQQLDNSGMDIIYVLNDSLMFRFQSLFPGCNFVHLNSSFAKYLPGYLTKSSDNIFVNVNKQYFDIIRFTANKQLQLMNRYDYKMPTDFLYFVLLCCDELKINREETRLVFIGEVDIQSKLFNVCYDYFRIISFIKQPEHVRFSKAFEHFPRHYDFNLYNLSA